MRFIRGFLMAWGNFSIIPCPSKKWDDDAKKHMLLMLPILGIVMGIIWYGLLLLLDYFHVHIMVQAALMTAYPFLISGGIHLDGFMDCNDAILSRRPMEEKQRILKDSNVGAFAVISMGLMFLVFFGAMYAILESGGDVKYWMLIWVMPLSRGLAAMSVLDGSSLPASQYNGIYRRNENLGWRIGATLIVVFIVQAPVSLAVIVRPNLFYTMIQDFYGFAFLAPLVIGIIAYYFAKKQLGGSSGDVAGYTLVWTELAAIVSLAVI